MSEDLVELLKAREFMPEEWLAAYELMDEAADRIEELEAQVKGLIHNAGVINNSANTIIEFTEDTLPNA